MTSQLLSAVKAKNLETAKQLIAKGADVNQLDQQGNSLLIVSSADGDATMVKLLLDSGADIKAVDASMKATALHAAAYLKHPQVMAVLCEYGIDIDAQGPFNGYTALHDAVWQNNIEGVKILIKAGAKLDLRGQDGKTPLDIAHQNHKTEIVAILEAEIIN